ncbi:TPM domain-containing protein [Massilia sp. PWRC2]|uniref:TPM domain-containing protein n=1 Tax=Massilia sp. PWRC2 TaxID=2804626 RepID=UPI003CFB7DDB
MNALTPPVNRLSRALRHLRSGSGAGRRAFPQEALAAIASAITAGEQTHRSELRLIVEAAMPVELVWAGVTNRQRALALFAEHGVWDTEDNCGILIYINLAERAVDIVADRAVGRCIDGATWNAVCADLAAGFARSDFLPSTLAAIERVNQLLREQFPSTGPRSNELPDRPLLM